MPLRLFILKQSCSSLTTFEGIINVSKPLPLKHPSVNVVMFLGIFTFRREVQLPKIYDLNPYLV